MIYDISDIKRNPTILKMQHPNSITIRKGKYPKRVIEVYCGFDIETTNIVTDKYKRGYMYHCNFHGMMM